jgi:hypothetical protein
VTRLVARGFCVTFWMSMHVSALRTVSPFAVLVCVALCGVHAAAAQELNPRAYVITPTDTNVINLGYSHLDGGLQFDGAVPITGATENINLAALGLYHSFGLLGRSANVAGGLPYAIGDVSGTVVDVPKTAHRAGLLDAFVRLSVNLIGGPAMGSEEFTKWRQGTLLGVSLKIVAPTGQYDPTRLINLGSNRWAFKPEVGYSQRWANWILDAYAGIWFFTQNPEFFSHNMYFPGVRSQSERPVAAFEGHLSYDIRPRFWVSLDANYWSGGETSLNGVENLRTYQRSSRVGATVSIPLTARHTRMRRRQNG